MDDGRLVGIITRSDAMSHFYGLCPLHDHLDRTCPVDVITTYWEKDLTELYRDTTTER